MGTMGLSRILHWGPMVAIGIIKWVSLTTVYCSTMWWPPADSLGGFLFLSGFLLFAGLTMFHFLSAMVDGPGYLPLGWSPKQGSKEEWEECLQWCVECQGYKAPRAHHCRKCGRCVQKMDHHCPWINNCVGEWNQKYFLQFLFYVGVLSAYSILLVAVSWSAECPQCPKDIMSKQARILHSVILVMESVLFGMFVIAIGCDQCEAIFGDETLVEQAKKQGPFRPRKPKMALMAEVCGRSHPLSWLIPCHSAPRSIDPASNYVV